MALCAFEKGKKVSPLSESWLSPSMVDTYDGQTIIIAQQEKFRLGNYLGSGIAGVVYEAMELKKHRHVAVKILNPVGYKLFFPQALARCEVIRAGAVYNHEKRPQSPGGTPAMPLEKGHVWWLLHPNQHELIPCYKDAQSGMIKEMTLDMCVALWPLDANNGDDDPLETDIDMASPDDVVVVASHTWHIPHVPKKYAVFLQNRRTIYREIAHMHRLTGNTIDSGPSVENGHVNVLQLFDVLEFVQPSKTTIFLVLELACGGEFFDRIKFDGGLQDADARVYFSQLLAGVQYCHELGIVHRDLKPENLLLGDGDVLKIADFGLSAHCIAAVSTNTGHYLSSSMESPASSSDVLGVPELPSQVRRLRSVVGSPHYVAPEVTQKCHFGYDGRKADMWSLGVILYTMLVGGLPFGKDLSHCPRFAQFSAWVTSSDDAVASSRVKFPSFLFPPSLRPDALRLLCSLLHPEPTKRSTCADALRSSWLVQPE
ncbi:CAMK/CAMKL protein kinase [Aphanomyces invadans]|uniref:non-specific serine/threonine protein kinase n=1 Tax=Aphanomyces invadans TaxID=157072 RepID=A0A024UQ67_9STRA|nr:CAMK/CAMKL protein kinase [Aphanomyces invadans]ETW07967.1 CAMK/CAMKL protein kinase [Aphanomyces invadans]RHY31665.1 hypothetical protein DYB32_003262 [Aphanomyces invadans]|eukprot:XP_008864060.1 CAMK/CAMKL protein kinase [Aphanomyces invadans]